ncbi:MAG: hypothetical protein FJY75_12815, partial [Candidatus Eisenbacteria bacterium]|nr:hypothetical protein [Candidatus Eisenbacteria bacterium]
GPDHPSVAEQLNSLALLLQLTDRAAEAEPICRRAAKIFLDSTARTGQQHPSLTVALGNYASIIRKLGVDDCEVRSRLNAMLEEYGMSLG